MAYYAKEVTTDAKSFNPVIPYVIDNCLFYDEDGVSYLYGKSGNNTSIIIPTTKTENIMIEGGIFRGNRTIKVIDLPSSVTSIGDYALYDMSPSAVICRATTPPILGSNNSFGGTKRIYVPFESIEAYQAAWGSRLGGGYTFFPILDVMLCDKTDAKSYVAALKDKVKSDVTSVVLFDVDASLTASVMKDGMNPNCLYFVPASAGLSGENFVKLDDYTAQKISLRDDYAFEAAIPFHANEVEYKHTPKVWANGHSGWETICLPFEATEYEASKSGEIVPIMLGGSGNFWLRRFAGASRNNVYFSSTVDGVMEAYTPYLVAFPGESMGNGHLQGETITFRGYGADITTMKSPELTKGNYTFVGNFDKKKDEATGWALDNAGGSFVLNENLGDVPFQSYFRAKDGAASVKTLKINFGTYDETDGIFVPEAQDENGVMRSGIYDLTGRRVDAPQRGIYIVNGKKQVVR